MPSARPTWRRSPPRAASAPTPRSRRPSCGGLPPRSPRRNGARVVSLRVVRAGAVPRAVDVAVSVAVRGSVPVAGQERRRVVARARAGVEYSAALPAGAFRPIALHGARGPLAAVAAAEAQVGWPYVWGGESRADGGFDCSGLVDFAYAAAGDALAGRPTAADLWRLSAPEPAGALAPSDLVFLGARSGAPHHVGMYVGDGMVVVAPHTGARVRFEPLAAGGWDGFGRLMAAGPAAPVADPAVEAAARAHQVPPDALAAELQLGLATDPDAAAAALAAAMRRHPGDLAAALGDALGDPSAGAFVLRAASGSSLCGILGGRPPAAGADRGNSGAVRAGAAARRGTGRLRLGDHRRRGRGREGARARGRAGRPPRGEAVRPGRRRLPQPAAVRDHGSGGVPSEPPSAQPRHGRGGGLGRCRERARRAARGRRAARLRAVGRAGDGAARAHVRGDQRVAGLVGPATGGQDLVRRPGGERPAHVRRGP